MLGIEVGGLWKMVTLEKLLRKMGTVSSERQRKMKR
jgi:hypothetical protein